jgi:hypothetical protein
VGSLGIDLGVEFGRVPLRNSRDELVGEVVAE